jgi:hypothetical protein
MTDGKTVPPQADAGPGPTVTSDPTPAPHRDKPADHAPPTEHHTVAAHDPKPDDKTRPD